MLGLAPGAISKSLSNEAMLAGIWAVAVLGAAAKIILARCAD